MNNQVFNHFSSIQLTNSSGTKTVMMSPVDFVTAMTPDCSIYSGPYRATDMFEEIQEENLAKVRLDKSPVGGESVLNNIGAQVSENTEMV